MYIVYNIVLKEESLFVVCVYVIDGRFCYILLLNWDLYLVCYVMIRLLSGVIFYIVWFDILCGIFVL